jgi:uncharacterized membrane protein
MHKISWRGPHFTFLFIALFAGLIFIMITPSFWGVDESTHFFRAYEVSQGHMISKKFDKSTYGDEIPSNLGELGRDTTKLLLGIHGGPIWQRNDFGDQDHKNKQLFLRLENSKLSPSSELTAFSGSAAYSPLPYIPAAIAINTGKVFNLSTKNIIRLARFMMLAVWALCVFTAIALISGRKKWIIFVVALLPMQVFQASIVNPDAIINGLAILYLGLYLKALELSAAGKKLSNRMIASIAITLAALSLAKPVYFVLGLTIIFLPAKLFVGRSLDSRFWKSLLLFTALIPALIWYAISAPVAKAVGSPLGAQFYNQVDPLGQLKYMAMHPLNSLVVFFRTLGANIDSYLISSIGLLGWNFVGMPVYLVVASAIILLLVSLYSVQDKNPNKHQSYVLLTAGIITVIGVFLVLYMTFNPVGASKVGGVQGRYFLPALPFVLVGLGRILPLELRASEAVMRRFCSWSSVIILALAITYYFIGTY